MVPYDVVDNPIKPRIFFVMALISISIVPWIKTLVGGSVIWLAPSAMSLFVLLYAIFDRYLWRLFHLNRLIGYPDLNGKWEGLVRIADGPESPCTMEIVQTWSRINIRLQTESTISNTIVVAIRTTTPNHVQVLYAYEVRHIRLRRRGDGFNTLDLTIENDKQRLGGAFFSDAVYKRGKHTGMLSVTKVE